MSEQLTLTERFIYAIICAAIGGVGAFFMSMYYADELVLPIVVGVTALSAVVGFIVGPALLKTMADFLWHSWH